MERCSACRKYIEPVKTGWKNRCFNSPLGCTVPVMTCVDPQPQPRDEMHGKKKRVMGRDPRPTSQEVLDRTITELARREAVKQAEVSQSVQHERAVDARPKKRTAAPKMNNDISIGHQVYPKDVSYQRDDLDFDRLAAESDRVRRAALEYDVLMHKYTQQKTQKMEIDANWKRLENMYLTCTWQESLRITQQFAHIQKWYTLPTSQSSDLPDWSLDLSVQINTLHANQDHIISCGIHHQDKTTRSSVEQQYAKALQLVDSYHSQCAPSHEISQLLPWHRVIQLLVIPNMIIIMHNEIAQSNHPHAIEVQQSFMAYGAPLDFLNVLHMFLEDVKQMYLTYTYKLSLEITRKFVHIHTLYKHTTITLWQPAHASKWSVQINSLCDTQEHIISCGIDQQDKSTRQSAQQQYTKTLQCLDSYQSLYGHSEDMRIPLHKMIKLLIIPKMIITMNNEIAQARHENAPHAISVQQSFMMHGAPLHFLKQLHLLLADVSRQMDSCKFFEEAMIQKELHTLFSE